MGIEYLEDDGTVAGRERLYWSSVERRARKTAYEEMRNAPMQPMAFGRLSPGKEYAIYIHDLLLLIEFECETAREQAMGQISDPFEQFIRKKGALKERLVGIERGHAALQADRNMASVVRNRSKAVHGALCSSRDFDDVEVGCRYYTLSALGPVDKVDSHWL